MGRHRGVCYHSWMLNVLQHIAMNIHTPNEQREQCPKQALNPIEVQGWLSLEQAMEARHSVRHYIHKPLSPTIVEILQSKIEECNRQGNLHIQLVMNERKAFTNVYGYGKFKGVENYFVMVGRKAADLDERVGYYGEQLVLLAQQLGLNTCWAGLSYHKVKGAYTVNKGEKLVCMIALGYGQTQGVARKSKTETEVSNVSDDTPAWFRNGVRAALLAPTAINQQKFSFEYMKPLDDTIPRVKAKGGFSIVGYTQMDLGIARLHFEIGAGKENFVWEDDVP